MKFAILLEPDIEPGSIRNDLELYAAVRSNGGALIKPRDADFEDPVLLPPEEFVNTWRGD